MTDGAQHICEGIVAAHQDVEFRDGVVCQVTIPEEPCTAEASLMSSALEEQTCNLGESHMIETDRHYWCIVHYQAAAIRWLDGTESEHAVQAPH